MLVYWRYIFVLAQKKHSTLAWWLRTGLSAKAREPLNAEDHQKPFYQSRLWIAEEALTILLFDNLGRTKVFGPELGLDAASSRLHSR